MTDTQSSSERIGWELLLAAVLGFLVTTGQIVKAQTETVLYAFTGEASGFGPQGGVLRDAKGNFYGTTGSGGIGFGTVYEVTAAGVETVLHSFTIRPADGEFPVGNLILAKGKLYGTTITGSGGKGGCGGYSCGTVFEVTSSGKNEEVLYDFVGGPDGAGPWAGLVRDAGGNFYGTTYEGGGGDGFDCIHDAGNASGCGTVFKVTPSGTETVLYRFTGGTDGGVPKAGLVLDAEGNLYGTTSIGGDLSCGSGGGCGTVFEVTPTGTETVLHSFAGYPNDGADPMAGLVRDAKGNLYGTTFAGGSGCVNVGCGTVFEVTSSGQETVLHSFVGGSDGYEPWAGLVRDAKGNLYGTTYGGGGSGCAPSYGCGTVFKVTPSGTETVLYRFTGGTDGGLPLAGLVLDKHGNLYGTTSSGGDPSCNAQSCGAVFEVTP